MAQSLKTQPFIENKNSRPRKRCFTSWVLAVTFFIGVNLNRLAAEGLPGTSFAEQAMASSGGTGNILTGNFLHTKGTGEETRSMSLFEQEQLALAEEAQTMSYLYFGMSALSAMQGFIDMGASKESGGVADYTSTIPLPRVDGPPLDGTSLPGTQKPDPLDDNNGPKPTSVTGSGDSSLGLYKVTTNADGEASVSTPLGELPASTFTDRKALAALGLSGSSIQSLQDSIAEANKLASEVLASLEKDGNSPRASAVGVGGASGGSGFKGYGKGKAGASRKSSRYKNPYSSFLKGMKHKRGVDKKTGRIPAGLASTFKGAPIGVMSDNIFKMISRRYDRKIRIKSFLPEKRAKGPL